MNTEVHWYDERHHILVMHHVGDWDWERFHAIFEAARGLASTVNYAVAGVQVMATGLKIPKTSALPHMRTVLTNAPPNLRHTVMVIQSPMMKNFLSTMLGLVGGAVGTHKIFFANSLEEAISILDQQPIGASHPYP
jgi:hypothetical protein